MRQINFMGPLKEEKPQGDLTPIIEIVWIEARSGHSAQLTSFTGRLYTTRAERRGIFKPVDTSAKGQ